MALINTLELIKKKVNFWKKIDIVKQNLLFLIQNKSKILEKLRKFNINNNDVM